MSNFRRFTVFTSIIALIGIVGCRSKEPVPSKASTAAPKSNDGPVLAPPQQQTTPGASQTDHASQPTEGDPAGKSAASTPPATPGEVAQALQPTEGDPTAKSIGDASKPASGETAEAAKIKANLASLSSEDRALAEKQKICPVSGEKLGSMGAPKKIHVAGRDVFICCEGCEDAVKDEPAKYLAKIGLQAAAEK